MTAESRVSRCHFATEVPRLLLPCEKKYFRHIGGADAVLRILAGTTALPIWILILFSLGTIFYSMLACSPSTKIDSFSGQEVKVDFAEERRQLVDSLRNQGVNDKKVLESIGKVPRHEFVPASQRHLAYANHPLPIGYGQTISQPYIVAYMTEAAEVTQDERVLEVGTGSGYQAAILANLAKEVYSIEIIPELAEQARTLLQKIGYKNIQVKTGDGYQGWPEHSPFSAILVTAAPDHVPKALVDQLAENGKMVIPVGTSYQELLVITKNASGVTTQRTIPVRFVPMTGRPEE